MHVQRRNIWLGCTAALLGSVAQLLAEDVTRPSIVGARLERKYDFDQTNYNLKVGQVTFRATAGLRTEFNDNINLSDKDKESDIILRPQVALSGFWPITPYNAISLTTAFSYSKYLRHSEFDDASKSFSIAPDSELSYDIFIGHFTVNLHDRFSIDQDPNGERAGSNLKNFGQFMNTAGTSLAWDVNKLLVLTLGYDHTNAIATTSDFRFTDYTQEQLSFLLRQTLSDKLAVGLEAGWAATKYKTDDKADGDPYHAGVFIDAQFTDYTRLRLAGGYQGINFNGSSAATLQIDPANKTFFAALSNDRIAAQDVNTFYVNAEFVNRLSHFFTQRLSVGKEASLAITAQSVDVIYARYNAAWTLNQLITLNLGLFIEGGRESGALQPEDYTRYGGNVNTSLALGRKLNAELGYNFTRKESNLDNDSYTQNVVYLGLNYTF